MLSLYFHQTLQIVLNTDKTAKIVKKIELQCDVHPQVGTSRS